MSAPTKRQGQQATLVAVHAADLTPDEKTMLAAYRDLNKDLQGFCIDIALSMAAAGGSRHVRPTLKVIAGGAN